MAEVQSTCRYCPRHHLALAKSASRATEYVEHLAQWDGGAVSRLQHSVAEKENSLGPACVETVGVDGSAMRCEGCAVDIHVAQRDV